MHVVLTGAYGMGNLGDEAIAEMAIRHLLDGQARGKLVISVSSRTAPSPDPGRTP